MEVLPNNSCCPTFGPNWVTWPSLAAREADQELQLFILTMKDVGLRGGAVNDFRKTAQCGLCQPSLDFAHWYVRAAI